MCGIAGFISNHKIKESTIKSMLDQIRHRGPDGSGINVVCRADEKISCSVGLGHVRLSILDLSEAGHQPMCYLNQYWITYNGEIYNYKELRRELADKGYQFMSQTDTEVILAAYAEWGANCLEHLNGMFAFLIFDRKNWKLFAARDRFGIKPLYYRVGSDGSIGFASEIKQFTVLSDWLARMNGRRVYDFLVFGQSDHTDETMFNGVFQFRPGEALLINLYNHSFKMNVGDRLPVYQWYKLKGIPFEGNMEEAGKMFVDLMTDSVKLRLRSDVPVGSCLSGGLDSSSIVVLINRLLNRRGIENQKTFSACTKIDRFDERKWIDIVVGYTGVAPHYVYPDSDGLFNDINRITWHQDEPFGSTSIFAQWEVFRLAAKNNVKVMLDGQGADELLAGYHIFFGPMLVELLTSFRWLRLAREISLLHHVHAYSLYEILQYIANALLPDLIASPLRRLTGKSYSSPNWLNFNKLGVVLRNPADARGGLTNSVRKMSYAQLTSVNLQRLLHFEDRNSMAHSIESRVPFLDYRLVEAVLGIPDEYKISNGVTKRVLREGMKNILPEKIRMRMDKIGFATPEEVWMRNNSTMFRTKAREAVEKSCGVLNDHAISKINDIIDGKKPFSSIPWRIISFGYWIDEFDVTV